MLVMACVEVIPIVFRMSSPIDALISPFIHTIAIMLHESNEWCYIATLTVTAMFVVVAVVVVVLRVESFMLDVPACLPACPLILEYDTSTPTPSTP